MDKKCIPYGSDVSGGQFRCRDCGEIITMPSRTSLPPCPYYKILPHPLKCWENISGQGDAPKDPYPKKKN
ncbi:MAG TPA: hypothetical protein PL056_13875 [bacterium]|nr:hypothetical protein [bacterium]